MTRLAAYGRAYFALQAIGGAGWWVGVFASPMIREITLGALDPAVVALFDIPLFVLASAAAALGLRVPAVVAAGWTSLVAAVLAFYATFTGEAGWGVLIMGVATAGSLMALSAVLLGRIPTEWILRGPFAFRPARTRVTAAPHLASTLGQLVVFWGFFLGMVPIVISVLERRWDVSLPFPAFVGPVAGGILVLASALGIWSAVTMSTVGAGTPLPSAMPNRLVTAGPYRLVRNPMAVAGISQGAAVGFLLGSWLVVAYAVIGSLVWNYAVRPLEEVDLEARFGEEYRRYRDAVRCWLPRARQLGR